MTPLWEFPPLEEGDLVRVVSPALPSMAFATSRRDRAESAFAELGLKIDYSAGCFEISDNGLSAGSPEQRAEDIMAAFVDPSVAAIICAVGGMTSSEVIDHLDADVIRQHPKPFIGRSDNLAINAYLHSSCQMASVAGATFLAQFGDDPVMPETRESFRRLLMGSESIDFLISPTRSVDGREWREMVKVDGHIDPSLARPRLAQDAFVRGGHGCGALLGAEIKQLPALLRQGILDPSDAVLWWDTAEEESEYVEEFFSQVADLADLSRLCGMIIGDNPWVPWPVWVSQVTRLVDQYVPEGEYPIYIGGDCGHYDPAWFLPYGAGVQLNSRKGLSFARGGEVLNVRKQCGWHR